MKSKFCFYTLLFLIVPLFVEATEPTQAHLTMRQNAVSGKFEIYAKFDFEGEFNLGSSLITIVIPEVAEDLPLVIVPSSGGGWIDGSYTYNHEGFDYHGIYTSGASKMICQLDTEIKLFEFTVPEGTTPVLWELGTHSNQASDGTDYITNMYMPNTGYYILPDVLNSTTGTDQSIGNLSSRITVFPNPTVAMIQISIPDSSVKSGELLTLRVFETSTNREVLTKELASDKTLTIDISSLPAAPYRLRLSHKGNPMGECIVIKHTK